MIRRAALALLLATAACGAPKGTIGAVLGRSDRGQLRVRDAPADLGAAEAGLQQGDQILLIDGMDVRLLNDDDLRAALRGPPGSTVKLTVLRGERVVRVTVRRTEARRRERAK